MMAGLLKLVMPRATMVPEHVPEGVAVLRSRWIPAFAGIMSGLGEPAAAVTLGDAIVVHPDVVLTPRLLRHELEHVHQWRRHSFLFPLRYAWSHLRYGYHDNPYEVEARAAEGQPRAPGGQF